MGPELVALLVNAAVGVAGWFLGRWGIVPSRPVPAPQPAPVPSPTPSPLLPGVDLRALLEALLRALAERRMVEAQAPAPVASVEVPVRFDVLHSPVSK